MIIGYSMPEVSSIAITGGTWLTADGGAACYDGKPARRARLQWSAGATLGSYVQITLTFSSTSPLRVLAALGLTVPAGVRIDFLSGSGGALGGTTSGARTVTMPDGTAGVFAVADAGGAATGGCIVRIYNDCSGATWASDGMAVDVGELVAMPGVATGIRDGWGMQTIDPGEFSRTRGGQLSASRHSAYRVLEASFSGLSAAAVRGAGLENSMDMDKLAAALRGGSRCVVVPHYRDMATRELDQQSITRSAIYGYASQIPNAANISRGYFTGQIVVEEIPAA